MIASLARIAEVPLDQVVTAHHLQCQLPDQPPRVAAVILQHVQDIQPASIECLVVIDLELHAHPCPGAPPVAPHSTRQVHRVYPFLRRTNILQLTRVDAYVNGSAIAVWSITMVVDGPSWSLPLATSSMAPISK
jgi:hypothetical protein